GGNRAVDQDRLVRAVGNRKSVDFDVCPLRPNHAVTYFFRAAHRDGQFLRAGVLDHRAVDDHADGVTGGADACAEIRSELGVVDFGHLRSGLVLDPKAENVTVNNHSFFIEIAGLTEMARGVVDEHAPHQVVVDLEARRFDPRTAPRADT